MRIGVQVELLSYYRRGLPLFRGTRDIRCDAVHLHWPERYFQLRGDGLGGLRKLRYPLDLALTLRRLPVFVTAHNLLPHNRENEPGVHRCVALTLRNSAGIFVHSASARDALAAEFNIPASRCRVIAHSDQTSAYGEPLERALARTTLGIDSSDKICLVFGAVSPYKGIEGLIEFRQTARPNAQLVILGKSASDALSQELKAPAQHSPNINLRVSNDRLQPTELRAWLSAADCALFNYTQFFHLRGCLSGTLLRPAGAAAEQTRYGGSARAASAGFST